MRLRFMLRIDILRSVIVVLAVARGGASAAVQGGVTRVSVGSAGQQGNGVARDPAISSDGKSIVFATDATTFDPTDLNGTYDIYMRRIDANQTVRISQMPDGTTGSASSGYASVSADGMRVAFESGSPFVPGDTGFADVFVRDISANTTVRASVALGGGQPNGASGSAKMSGDGRFVAFLSLATNLIPNDANGGHFNTGIDAFVRDLVANTTELAHVSSAGVQGNSSIHFDIDISHDGRFVGFASWASNLVPGDTNFRDVFVRDRTLGTTERVSVDSGGVAGNDDSGVGGVAMSFDGRFIVFPSLASNFAPGDTNNFTDIFVRDRLLGITERASVAAGGVQGGAPGIPWNTLDQAISGDGRFVSFGSEAPGLVPFDLNNQFDMFIRDRLLDTTQIASLNSAGVPGNNSGGGNAQFTPDGNWIVFESASTDLVPGDTNGLLDVYLLEREKLSPSIYCTAATNSQGCVPAMSWSGTPSATATNPFDLRVDNVLSNRSGILLYGVLGPRALPSTGGTLCVRSARRGPIANSGGTTPCSGVLSCDFNAFIASGVDPSLVVGRSVWTQFFTRDPQAPSTVNLSNAVFFLIEP